MWRRSRWRVQLHPLSDRVCGHGKRGYSLSCDFFDIYLLCQRILGNKRVEQKMFAADFGTETGVSVTGNFHRDSFLQNGFASLRALTLVAGFGVFIKRAEMELWKIIRLFVQPDWRARNSSVM